MPIVQATIIEGYDDATKARLLQGMTRAVLSVMAARPEAVVATLNELKPSAYARGGVSRVPGPPLPCAVDVVHNYLAASLKGDEQGAQALLADDACCLDGAGKATVLAALSAIFQELADGAFDEALTDDGSVVYARSTAGQGCVARFHVRGGRIVTVQVWGNDNRGIQNDG